MSAPMTAEEIRADLLREMRSGGLWASLTYQTFMQILDAMRAREREHADLLARVERLEKEGDDGR